METIQVVLDKKLLQATDRAAHRTKRKSTVTVAPVTSTMRGVASEVAPHLNDARLTEVCSALRFSLGCDPV